MTRLNKTFFITTLGCFRNTYDSQTAVQRFLDQGYSLADKPQGCDLVAVNTCGFITSAKKESLSAIQSALDLKKSGKIKQVQVFGCLVKRYFKSLKKAFPEVDQWWGVEDFGRQTDDCSLTPNYTAFLKISEGCANCCSYCAIPLIKGPLVSRDQSDIIDEVKRLNDRKIAELNIIGQDITAWGLDKNIKNGFAKLVVNIVKAAPKIKWIRLMYLHPRHIDTQLLEVIAGNKQICRYLDLPIQHINDRILRAMNRQITSSQIQRIIDLVRAKIPEVKLRTSVITGFPSETQQEFDQLKEFLKKTRFDRLGAFVYSREEKTQAAKIKPQIAYAIRVKRFQEIMSQQAIISCEIASEFIGKELSVLIERKQDQFYVGRSQYDAIEVDPEVIVYGKDLEIGKFYKVKINDTVGYDLIGRIK